MSFPVLLLWIQYVLHVELLARSYPLHYLSAQPLLLLIGIPTLALTPSPCSFEWLVASKSHVALVLILSTAALQCLRYLIEQVEVDKLRPRLPG